MTIPAKPMPSVPYATKAAIFLRLFAIQGAWNYETLLGNGIAFCVEPSLRLLHGRNEPEKYRQAIAREARYFNAHPYLASLAVGALARAELDQVDPVLIERFRRALGGPLGSVGDRLIWASWLPFCSLLALCAFGLGASPGWVLLIFLGVYNVGHIALRAWGVRTGFRKGMRVSEALGNPLLRKGPTIIGGAACLVAGFALPLAFQGIIGPGRGLSGAVFVIAILGTLLLARFGGRGEGWRLALVVLSLFVLFSVVR